MILLYTFKEYHALLQQITLEGRVSVCQPWQHISFLYLKIQPSVSVFRWPEQVYISISGAYQHISISAYQVHISISVGGTLVSENPAFGFCVQVARAGANASLECKI